MSGSTTRGGASNLIQKPVSSSEQRRIALRRALLAIAVIGLGIYTWFEILEDRLIPKRFGVVVEGKIFRSAQLHPALVEETLQENGIRRVVALRDFNERLPDHVAERDAASRLGAETYTANLRGDGTGDVEIYLKAIGYMVGAARGGEPVLVHCASGVYRTGAAVAWYRVLVEGWPADEAVAEMLAYDWNPRNAEPLRYMNERMAYVAAELHSRGWIDEYPHPLPVFVHP